MKTHQTTDTQGTTGTMTAHIENPQVIPSGHDFVGAPDRMVMLQVGGEFRMHSTQIIGATPNHRLGFDFLLPQASVPADGVTRTFDFPTNATGYYWAFENSGGQPYRATRGQLRLALHQDAQAIASFEFTGLGGTKNITVTDGEINLRGFTTPESIRHHAPSTGTGSFTGSFAGGPVDPQFNAQEVSIRRFDLGVVPAYYDVQGRVVGNLRETFVSIWAEEGATGQTFDLATSTEVRVGFFDFPSHGFAYAIKGTLTFTSKPDTGRAAGTLRCTFQKNNEPTFTFDGTFDVTA